MGVGVGVDRSDQYTGEEIGQARGGRAHDPAAALVLPPPTIIHRLSKHLLTN